MNKRTKIICTVGPASGSVTKLEKMMRAGMDVARLNFSHSTHEDHKEKMAIIRKAANAAGKHVPIIADMQGPKIRLGKLPEDGVELPTGESVTFTTATTAYTRGAIPVTYRQLHKDVKKGHRIMIEDGIYELVVTRVTDRRIRAKVINGGVVTSHKGMNFPDSQLSVSSITSKDRKDAIFAIEQGAEWIALSFVTSPAPVRTLKRLIKRHTPEGLEPARVIVKIEKHEAIDQFDAILAVTDGVMIARGDLGVEIDAEEVPLRQKEIIEKCRLAGVPVVVATQMLDSMIRNPRPTRAEVSDVANAVIDHTDAVMLSGESATGKHPLKAVRMMTKIIQEAEQSRFDDVPFEFHYDTDPITSLSLSVNHLAVNGSIQASLASMVLAPWSVHAHKAHPEVPLYLAAPNERLARQESIRWGVETFVMKSQTHATFARTAMKRLQKHRRIKKHKNVVVITGHPEHDAFDIIDPK